ncbi:hypothetical protein BD779DRAFT_1466334 [Infundibulicybe gibba]|nr:hypothetical protein BD779DRAFT_1466334 [Infundibulicybe gibba]
MSFTVSPMPTTSSYDDDTLSASAALAWKFYAFGMLGIFVTGILATVIYLACFRLRKPIVSQGDVEAPNSTNPANKKAVDGIKPISFNERKLSESCYEPMSASRVSSSTTTLVSAPPRAYVAARGEGSPEIYIGERRSDPAPHVARNASQFAYPSGSH